MGEKAATNEVITELMIVMNFGSLDGVADSQAVYAIGNILRSSVVIKQLAPKVVADLCLSRYASDCFKNISADDLINVFFTTKDSDWLPAVTRVALLKRVAIAVTENKVVLYDKTEPVELSFPHSELRERFIEAFIDQEKRIQLCAEITLETGDRRCTSFDPWNPQLPRGHRVMGGVMDMSMENELIYLSIEKTNQFAGSQLLLFSNRCLSNRE
jgi:hypothetical protein